MTHHTDSAHSTRVVPWVVVIITTLLCASVSVWEPARYQPLPSKNPDPSEAVREDMGNKLLADALNGKRLAYHTGMANSVQTRPDSQMLLVDLLRVLIFPTVPLLMIGRLIRASRR